MSDSSVPFYTQAAILDRYIHSSTPEADPGALEVILETLRSRPDLRAYFFRSGPDPAWAEILWDKGFFEHPPLPQKTEGGGVMLPRWDVQEYLVSVADQVPDIVVRHVQSVPRQGWYILQAIRALCSIPSAEIEGVVSRIVEWLADPQIAQTAAEGVTDLTAKLTAEGHAAAAFALFRALVAPVPSSDVRQAKGVTWRGEARSRLRSDWEEDQTLSKGIALLEGIDNRQLVAILEEHLCMALQLEAAAVSQEEFEFESWWRVAIEDTGQDLNHDYKHKLLRALRDALEHWVQRDPDAAKSLVDRYFREPHQILRRLGLHILCRFPSEYQEHVVDELRKLENLDDVGIHHEFFILLQVGYPYLKPSDQEILVDAIRSGPSPDRVERLAQSAHRERGADPDEYAQHMRKTWICDRLWMIREHLDSRQIQILDSLVEELAAPEHPAFTRWSAGVHWVKDVSPITEQEIAQMSPEELLEFLHRWRPEFDTEHGPERVSYRGLADIVAGVIISNPQRYVGHVTSIARCHSAFACALLDQLRKDEHTAIVPWEISLSLCEDLLADETIRTDMSREWDGNWVWARKSIVDLLQVGLRNQERIVPAEHLPRVRDILLILVDDPDPDLASDRPTEGWAGHRDPATIAINHVRSSALIALIEYARTRALAARGTAQDAEQEGPSPQRLELIVRETLSRKLDREKDPSWAVHSTYGRYLPLLYWLDQEWVESHIDRIFPEADDEESIWFYVAAWDSYVIFNHFHLDMVELLRSKYERAVYNLGKGYVTQTHLQPEKGLGVHLTWEYLLADYDLASSEGQRSLIAKFFEQAPPEERGTPAWLLGRIGEENPSEFEEYWPRARSLWEWRTNEASTAGHPTDFDREMEWFANILLVVSASETIATLWPLLEGMLPHITRSEQRNMGWDAVEKYLSRQIERDPLRAIQFYHLMHSQLDRPRWYYPEEGLKIIEVAAEHGASRRETLSLIDLLGRLGDYRFKDIYDRYAG